MKKVLAISLGICLFFSGFCFGACPSADITGDCKVDIDDFGKMAGQWLMVYDDTDLEAMAGQWLTTGTPEPDIIWVSINDSGAGMKDENGNPISQGGFNGEMSQYETTNAQFAEYLNAALATGDINVSGNYVVGAAGSNAGMDFVGQTYYYLAGSGDTYNGATDGGAARINWTGSSFTVDAGFGNHPVTYVSWYGATAFARYYGWRLPTEWEWQSVADYNGTYVYGCGATITNSIANYYGSTHPHGTTLVGQFGTYGYGMADMAGNVWEWTSSLWDPAYSLRVLRGGFWDHGDYYCEVSRRNSINPVYVSYNLGFRVCR